MVMALPAPVMATVVNIYTHSDYVGATAKAYYGQSSEGDREIVNINLLMGRDVGESNFMFAASFTDQKAVFTQDRELTAVPLNGLSTSMPAGLFREISLGSVVDFTIPSGGITRNPNTDGTNLDSWRGATSSDTYNRYENNYVVGPNERASVYLQALMPMAMANLRVKALYNRRESDQQFSPALSPISGSRGFSIANDPLVNPFGIAFGGSDFRHTSFMVENGYRINEQRVETMRLGLGLDGEVHLSSYWAWDGLLLWAKNAGTFTSNNQLHLDKLALGLRACDTAGIETNVSDLAAGCVPINLFNPLSDAMVDYINFTGEDENEASQLNFTLNITGTLIELPAGELAMTAGIEYRKEKGKDAPDNFINSEPRLNNFRPTSSAPRVGTDGEYDLKEAYVELNIPLIKDASFADLLEVSLATRFSDCSNFGSTTNRKAGILYSPTEGLSFRATLAEGFRAPSILELFEGEHVSSSPVLDPCSGNSSLPGCAGVPSEYMQGETNVQLTTGGGRLLQPETSENISYGVVFFPDFIEDFSVTLDWYDIEIDNTISIFGPQEVLDLYAIEGKNCDVISRASNGEILNILDGPINLNNTRVAGMDIFMTYALASGMGDWNFTLNLSQLSEFEQGATLSDCTVRVENKVGEALLREAFPEGRGSFTTHFKVDAWSLNYNLRYIGDTDELVQGQTRQIGSVLYQNTYVSYDFNDATNIKLGVNNLADKQPPSSLTNPNINYEQITYNPIGRFTYLQLSYQF
jgi:outer membrane receptor protein involved in Fe transport